MEYNNEFYETMLQNIYEGVYFVNPQRKILFWNKGAERITGFTAAEVVNKFCYNNILQHIDEEGKKLCHSGCPLHASMEDGIIRDASVYLHHKDGHRVPISIKAIPMRENGKIVGAIEIFWDDSEKQNTLKSFEELKSIALTDQLTGLPNRRYIDSFLQSKVNEYFTLGLPFGILFMDIDKFKVFNDSYGHDTGDEVLKVIASTFRSNVRITDLIGRWGGEEFISAFSCANEDGLLRFAEKLRALVEQTFIEKNGQVLKVTISIGATLFYSDDTIDSTVKRADKLLFQSKENGRNRVTIG